MSVAQQCADVPERLIKCRRLDELLHRLVNNNNNYDAHILNKADLFEAAPLLPDYYCSLYSPEHDDDGGVGVATEPPAPPSDQDRPLDLSLKTETPRYRRDSVSPLTLTTAAEKSGRRRSRAVAAAGSRMRAAAQHTVDAAGGLFSPSPIHAVVEQVANDAGLAYACPTCGQMFSLHDRLAKHIASRHRAPRPQESSARAHECDLCHRRFARSDMLTRHARLHTGVKPYACAICGQVFTRSDHLSTHQRTHTGEKPYKCPVCAYAACRRDMITRHMRTHSRARSGSPSAAALSLKPIC